jgi:bifunctional DNA-binding transcriptional regulator/antitoxin component of YhaV-PrlF toxin-antitoxin module
MSNRVLSLFLGLMVGVFGVWLFLDLRKTRESAQEGTLRHDTLAGSSGGFGATAQYDFVFPTPVFRRELSTAEIGRLVEPDAAGATRHPGLTDVRYSVGTRYRFGVSRRWFQEGVKMWVENLRVDFGFTSIDVYLSRDYPEGSCQYQTTLEHETEHLEAHRRVYEEYQVVLREALRKAVDIPTKDAPRVFAAEAEGKAAIEKAISLATDPVFEAFRQADEEAQAVIDSRASYEAVRQRCGSW